MNEVGWLPAKNSPFGKTVEIQKSGNGAGKSESFAAFLSEGGAPANGKASGAANVQAQQTGSLPRAPASVPQSAVDPTNAGAQDAFTLSSGNQPAFFAASAQGQASYNAAPGLNDEAIAFNARPIVGPASFGHSADDVFSAVEGVDNEAFAAARAELRGSIGFAAGHLVVTPDRAGSQQDNRLGIQPGNGSMPVSASTPRSAPVFGTASATSQGAKAVRIDAPLQPLVSGNSAKGNAQNETNSRSSDRASSSAPTLPVHLSAAQNSAFAQILASPSEYRLVIRGQRLSEDMREHVLRAVRSGLAEFGLPTLPLSVFDQEGRS